MTVRFVALQVVLAAGIFASPWLAGSWLAGSWSAGSWFASPWLSSPGFSSPGFASPGSASPGFAAVASAEEPNHATAFADEARSRPVTRREVWRAVVAALRDQGLDEQQLPGMEDLVLPAAPPARADRTLRVAAACWDEGRQHTQFLMQCGAPGQCLPFLAYLPKYFPHRFPSHIPNDFPNDVRDAVSLQGSGHDVACGSGSQAARDSSSGAGPRSTRSDAAPRWLVRPGDAATAVFRTDHLRMTARVICLDRGGEGDIIRVRAPDGHAFKARILGAGMLESVPQ